MHKAHTLPGALLLTLILLASPACSKSNDNASVEQVKASAQTKRFGTATLSGTVNYNGPMPEALKRSYKGNPDCQKANEGQPAIKVVDTTDNKLAKAFVYIKSGLPKGYKTPTEPVVLDQRGCEYAPRVVGVQVGQSLRILNSDPMLHNVHAKPEVAKSFNLAMPFKGMKIDRKFEKSEVMVDMKCDVHSWMSAYVGVVDHPFFQVTGADGTYRFEKLPAGSYEVEVWHETLGRLTRTLDVQDNAEISADFSFQPAA